MSEEHSYYHGSYGPHDYGEYESGYAVNEVDIIFERSEDGTELGLTIRGTDYGPSAISRILEAIAIHDINTVDPLQGMKEVLEQHAKFDDIRVFHGNSEELTGLPVFAPDDHGRTLPLTVGATDRVWHLRIDYPGKEIAIKHPDGPAVLRGPFDAPNAKELSTTFFTQLTQALDRFAPTASAGNAFIIFERDGASASGVRVHMPYNGPDALSCVMSWLRDTDRSIVGKPELAATGIIKACNGIDPVVVPFETDGALLNVEQPCFSNDCPIIVVDCPGGMLRLEGADASVLAEEKLHKSGAGRIRKELHQVFRERGISMAPDFHNRYGWKREYAGVKPAPF